MPPPPWELAGTSSVASPSETPPTHRVDRRYFTKDGHFLLRAGFSYLSRGDYYTNPGIGFDLTYYPFETLGVDIVSGTAFFSQLGTTAKVLREQTGLLPDSQRPYVRAMTGARLALIYGKLLVEMLDVVIHMDASLTAHLGLMITDQAPNMGGDFGLSFQASASDRVVVWLEALYLISYEERTASSVASGPLATIGLGFKI